MVVLPDGRRAERYVRALSGAEEPDMESEAIVKLRCTKKGTDVYMFCAVNLDARMCYGIGLHAKEKFLREGHRNLREVSLPYRFLNPLEDLLPYLNRSGSQDRAREPDPSGGPTG